MLKVCSWTSQNALSSFFGIFWAVATADISEAHVLLVCSFLISHLSLHMEANHQLVDHHANNSAEERGKNGHQEPALPSPEYWQKRIY